MATITRQPFAPLDGARLQTLTSLKNRQNALSNASSPKRKASDSLDTDDSENVDPVLHSKRSKGSDNVFVPKDSFVKPSFILTKSASANDVAVLSPPKAAAAPRARSLLNPRSPASKSNISSARSTPLSAPAGRSPTRGKRTGILSSRQRTKAFSRVNPPNFGSSSASPAPFSLDAALKGTIPSYNSRSASSSAKSSLSSSSLDLGSLHEGEMKQSWFFDIHEDTPEQEMTNLLQHSTCVLDISSDEESETRRQRERAEGKENVPPVDDVSQTSRPRASRPAADDEMMFEKERSPLGEMNVREYYSEGCDENTIVIIPGDDEEANEPHQHQQQQSENKPDFTPLSSSSELHAPQPSVKDGAQSVDQLMGKADEPAPSAAVLEPVEGTGESFEVWESGSAKDETETETEMATAEATEC
ncbi:uncharacterized protein F4812DRAFT_79161 [Daldinia caldariorum]|uniref:uncharacterized protein n=1 Tax=Daldinia caldariorum TaxID=326644 RepID=UPI002007CA0A|nr:uncharacterized protein F4812DRAFT_79161 [Daldinia caldariorum]KAI1466453.1 hypothetical protein F4812DRAFT_79161 [Daldinia caldariorum]